MKTPLIFSRNTLLSDPIRLSIVVAISSASEPVDFNSLLSSLELSRGNLSSHVRKLEEANLVKVHKEFVDRRPKTTYSLTNEGDRELKEYLINLEPLLKMVGES
jgi:DNA-binding transcriptional ArsR family regulator